MMSLVDSSKMDKLEVIFFVGWPVNDVTAFNDKANTPELDYMARQLKGIILFRANSGSRI